MSSTTSAPSLSVATMYRERAARMLSWMTKLNLALALCDSWELLDPKFYPKGSAARAAKAMELVTQTVLILIPFCDFVLLLTSPIVPSPHVVCQHPSQQPTSVQLHLL